MFENHPCVEAIACKDASEVIGEGRGEYERPVDRASRVSYQAS